MQEVQIKDIERLVIRPGEILVVTVQNDISAEQAELIKEMVEAKLPEGIEVLIKTQNLSLSVVTDQPHD